MLGRHHNGAARGGEGEQRDTRRAGAVARSTTGALGLTNASAAGWLSLTPAQDNAPSTSTLNFPVGDVRANGATVRLAADGSLALVYRSTAGATTHLMLDVTGYYAGG